MSTGAVHLDLGDVEGGVHLRVDVAGETAATLCLDAEETAALVVEIYRVSGQKNSDLARNFRQSQAVRS